ncbi:hypothetical protein JCM18382A_00900 [Bradyrhizobium sp. 17-4]
MLAAPIEIAAPIMRRRRLRAGLAAIMSEFLQANGFKFAGRSVRPWSQSAPEQAFGASISAGHFGEKPAA